MRLLISTQTRFKRVWRAKPNVSSALDLRHASPLTTSTSLPHHLLHCSSWLLTKKSSSQLRQSKSTISQRSKRDSHCLFKLFLPSFHVHLRQGVMSELVTPHVALGGIKTAYVMVGTSQKHVLASFPTLILMAHELLPLTAKSRSAHYHRRPSPLLQSCSRKDLTRNGVLDDFILA